MALSRLVSECQECPFRDNCDHKRMEMVGVLPEPMVAPPAETAVADLTQPILRETMTIMVNGNPTIVYKDEIQKELNKHLFKGLGLQYGG